MDPHREKLLTAAVSAFGTYIKDGDTLAFHRQQKATAAADKAGITFDEVVLRYSETLELPRATYAEDPGDAAPHLHPVTPEHCAGPGPVQQEGPEAS